MGSALKQIWDKWLLFTVVSHAALADESSKGKLCADDFSPCTCAENNNVVLMVCDGIYGVDIRDAFSRPTSINHIDEMHIYLPSDCGFFPADMLSGKTVSKVSISGKNCDFTIDSNAFASSSDNLTVFYLERVNLRFLDFAFLNGFSALTSFSVSFCPSIYALQSLPSLPTLKSFDIYRSVGSANMTDFPAGRSFAGLQKVSWIEGDLNDEVADVVFGAITQTSSAYTLDQIYLSDNLLTKIPTAFSPLQIPAKYLDIRNNKITVLKTGSVLFHVKTPENIILTNNPIAFVEPTAFVGKSD